MKENILTTENPGWALHEEQDGEVTTVHVSPIGDYIEHEPENCLCGPNQEIMSDADFTKMFIISVHNSLDGREQYEE